MSGHQPQPRSRSKGAKVKADSSVPASERIDQRIHELNDWRGKTLARMRKLILTAAKGIVEEWKWRVPVWSLNGIICTGEVYQQTVKFTFAQGARLPDPHGLFNASLQGNSRRAIDLRDGERMNAAAFQALIRAAVKFNQQRGQTSTKKQNSTAVAKNSPNKPRRSTQTNPTKVVLLSGGNPQIAKGDGEGPVQAYIAAMPGWKSALGKRLDQLIVRTLPGVQKAVKWNSPFYGTDSGWFLAFHVFARYVKVAFFQGRSLRPMPPGGTPKSQETRWIDIHETDAIDEDQFADWIRQAARLPGWIP